MPIGPLALRDMNGADIGANVARINYQEYGERYAIPQVLLEMVAKNMLGVKTLAGFYLYDPETRKKTGVNPELEKIISTLGQTKATKKKSIEKFDAEQLFLPMINEAFLVLQERICQPEDLDPALMAGLGMRKGPLAIAAQIGLKECLARMESKLAAGQERFRPAPLLKRFVFAGRTEVV
jgi:3-hydroxyacyl-CoA dehydrogenase